MRFAVSLKLGECCTFNSSEHSTANMLVSNCAQQHYLFNAVRDGWELAGNGQEVTCHTAFPLRESESTSMGAKAGVIGL